MRALGVRHRRPVPVAPRRRRTTLPIPATTCTECTRRRRPTATRMACPRVRRSPTDRRRRRNRRCPPLRRLPSLPRSLRLTPLPSRRLPRMRSLLTYLFTRPSCRRRPLPLSRHILRRLYPPRTLPLLAAVTPHRALPHLTLPYKALRHHPPPPRPCLTPHLPSLPPLIYLGTRARRGHRSRISPSVSKCTTLHYQSRAS